MSAVPAHRLRVANAVGLRPDGDYVLYWMIAQRRTRWNFALERAVELARSLGKGLVVLEALRCGYPWASDRLHRFVVEGMADNARRLAGTGALYHAYLERRPGEASGLLEELAERACAVVTDEFPCFFLPRMVAAAAERLPVRLEVVDGNGLLPLRAADRTYGRAVDLRRFLQRVLPEHIGHAPRPDPLEGAPLPEVGPPAEIAQRWPNLAPALRAGETIALDQLPIDHAVAPVARRGGAKAGEATLASFLERRLHRYVEDRLDLDNRANSELSPYLHFGHLSIHQVFHDLCRRERWSPASLVGVVNGAKEGFWGMSAPAEAFLDEAITWRELGYNVCWREPDLYHRYDALPAWCRATLEKHQGDPRPWCYALEDFEQARTHDELWNAAQRELRLTGGLHNYLRMLWGKKILEWSPSPRVALDVMIELNNKYAIDGRNPNSYSGIFWCLGRYDRPWAPERPIFGQIRYMSSDSTRRKLDVRRYLQAFGPLSLA